MGDLIPKTVLGLLICTGLVIGAKKKNALTASGALMAWVFGMTIVLLVGLPWFLVMLLFFVVGALATRYKYAFKEGMGTAEHRLGARSWENVLANGITPMLFVLSEFIYPGAIFLVGYLGAVSTALADTLSSEIGMTSPEKPWLITTFKRVNAGTHGGISFLGTTVSLLGCLLLGLVAWSMRMEAAALWRLGNVLIFCVVGGMVGGTVDSILGALFERKGKMSNSQVNLLSTLAGGMTAVGVFLLL